MTRPLKENLVTKFKKAAAPAVNGLGAAFAAHAGCIALPIGAAVAGVSLSGAFMLGATFISAPLVAMAVTAGVSRKKTGQVNLKKTIKSAGFALVATAGIQMAHFAFSHDNGSNVAHDQSQSQNFDMAEFLKNRPICGQGPTS